MQVLPFTNPLEAEKCPPRRIVRGDGIRVFDDGGNSFIDAVSALWCAPLGFSPARLEETMTRQMRELAYYHSFMGRAPAITDIYAARLIEKLPNMARVLFSNSGSEAVETAAKCAGYYWHSKGQQERRRIIARDGAYHGSLQASAALTAMPYCHDGLGLRHDQVLRTGRPHYLRDAAPGESEVDFSKRRAKELDALICQEDPGTIGAFIGEPAMGAGGVILPPDGYWAEIQNVLGRHGILLIADEVICGFGRTGQWFACETYDIHPDMIFLAKQMTASVFPMSAVAMSRGVYDVIKRQAGDFGTFGHGVTYGGHPIGAAVALECLEIYEEMNLTAQVQRLGARIMVRLEKMRARSGVLDVRCKGMLAAVEFETDEQCSAVARAAEARGVFFRVVGPVLALAPPYICSTTDIDQIMDVLDVSLDDVRIAA